MNKKFDELFDEAISFWPRSLSVKEKIFHDNGGVTIPDLITVHDAIEERTCAQSNNYMLRQMDWAIYTLVHELLKCQDSIDLENIPRDRVQAIFEENIQ
jgi:hypothetical protein